MAFGPFWGVARRRLMWFVLLGDETREGVDFHTEMEARLKMNW